MRSRFIEDTIVRMKRNIDSCYEDATRAFDQGFIKQAKDLVNVGRQQEDELDKILEEFKQIGVFK